MTLAKPHLSSAYVSRHVSRDDIYHAFSPLFVLQVTKPGHGGLGTRLTQYTTGTMGNPPTMGTQYTMGTMGVMGMLYTLGFVHSSGC